MKISNNFFWIVFLFCINSSLNAQSVTRLSDMPEAVTNQAVTYANVNGQGFVYSFSGLDSTKLFSGIHNKGFKYNISNDSWERIAPLPSGNGRIAAGASFVKDKIYIIGGYEVFEDDSEISVDLVHVYDPSTDTFLGDGTPIPVPIDDHIQAVWRDSLIYVVTGWSNTTNVPDVQIYNPSMDTWQVGTPVPNNNTYKVFGSSGVILGDTIYYAGGAKISGGSFGFSNVIRKGVINPENPTEITWTHKTTFDAIGYRMGAASWYDDVALWIGGSRDAYNYDGVSYSTGEGVEPYERLLSFNPQGEEVMEIEIELPIMDNREVAQIGPSQILICGGIGPGQKVENSTYLVETNIINTDQIANHIDLNIYPSPAADLLFIKDLQHEVNYQIYDTLGLLIMEDIYSPSGISIRNLSNGVYQIRINKVVDSSTISVQQFVKS